MVLIRHVPIQFVRESLDPERAFCYTPGICRLEGGRLVATMDFWGPGVKSLPETRAVSAATGKPAVASELVFEGVFDPARSECFGVPFLPFDRRESVNAAPHRPNSPPGCLETNVVQFDDPDHVWHDPSGRTFHLWMRAHTAGTGYARAKSAHDGNLITFHRVKDFRKLVY